MMYGNELHAGEHPRLIDDLTYRQAQTDREVLSDAGKVTAEIARAHAEREFEKYRIVQDRLFESDFDRLVAEIKHLGEGLPPKGKKS